MNKKEYKKKLEEKKREHLKFVNEEKWMPCFHDGCSECLGTGIKKTGGTCIHYISCPCPKCTPIY